MPLESQIQAEVDQLRDRFPATKDLYREVCVLLFFRYGVTPTANKLYGFVRKGSMSAPANALDAFWRDLREKSRVRIESPDIPAALLETVGETFSALWRQAQEYAECNFTQRMLEATEQVELLKSEAETTASRNLDLEAGIESLKLQLVEADQRAKDIERLRLTDCSTLAAQDKTITSLSAERDRLVKTLEDLRKAFSRDLAIMAESMKNAEQQFAMLESKAQAELKTARQGALKLEKENAVLRKSAKSDQERLGKVIATLQAKIAGLSESHGNLTGRLSGLSGQYKTACSRLKEAERKLAAPKAPARRTNKRVTNK